MKLGIMQPYFFPYLGYFSLIKNVDKWIVFDTVQYIEHGWVNRNRIIHPNKPEDMYIIVPLKSHTRNTKIKDIYINNEERYKEKILAQIWNSYKKRAPFFKETYELVEEVLSLETKNIVDLNVYGMDLIMKYLEIPFDYQIFSKMDLKIDKVNDAGEWALNISKAMGADIYINPPGGINIFDRNKFEKSNIKLKFLKVKLEEYSQKKSKFIEGLSIIDVMMFNSKEKINEMLNEYEYL